MKINKKLASYFFKIFTLIMFFYCSFLCAMEEPFSVTVQPKDLLVRDLILEEAEKKAPVFPKEIAVPDFLQQISKGIESENLEEIIKAFDNFLQKIPKDLKKENDKEGFYHSLVHTFLRFLPHNVISDTPKGSGETDTFVSTGKRQYIFEFKINTLKKEASQQEIALEALKQIFTRAYYKPIQQRGIPTTLAGVSFHPPTIPKKVEDQFKELTCCALDLKKPNYSLYAYPYNNPEETIGRHSEFESFCTYENWDKLHVKGSSAVSTEESSGAGNDHEDSISICKASMIDHYDEKLKSIQEGLLYNDISLIFQNIDYILQDVPWSLRVFNRQYFQAIMYTAFLCTGLEVVVDNDCIIVKTDEHCFSFICSFTHKDDEGDVRDEMFVHLLEKCSTITVDDDMPMTLVVFNVNQVPPVKDHDPKNKISLKSRGVMLKKDSVYTLNSNKFINSINRIERADLMRFEHCLNVVSPRTPADKKLLIKMTSDSPYKPFQPTRR